LNTGAAVVVGGEAAVQEEPDTLCCSSGNLVAGLALAEKEAGIAEVTAVPLPPAALRRMREAGLASAKMYGDPPMPLGEVSAVIAQEQALDV
jgi:hypothetical protein